MRGYTNDFDPPQTNKEQVMQDLYMIIKVAQHIGVERERFLRLCADMFDDDTAKVIEVPAPKHTRPINPSEN